jgi:creatinine amidohydrolase
VAEKTGGFYIPALPISTNKEMRGKRGSVGMSSDTFYRMIFDICEDLKRQGFRKIGIIQAHGGIFVMTPVVRELNEKYNPDLMVAKLDLLEIGWPHYFRSGLIETNAELHAGEVETSMMLYLHPELVDMSKAEDYVPDVPRSSLSYGSIYRYSPSARLGRAHKGHGREGRKAPCLYCGKSRKRNGICFFFDGKEAAALRKLVLRGKENEEKSSSASYRRGICRGPARRCL